ncbi:uncharacterized protein PGTG_21207 [Puccinia graminis f. sp. tritici CRL 75-36-700-3]|uniref:Uncharacterized protein n=1 Tax=Puccinia graminis f. sp. tritici (strain CRL 75-36-700-3 / race SCCL) TaxID=418459 RepID=H6QQM3_PUCGT|nr:uncharacterized protein PGTG_21207 [Puccinia graminis f. sp. tritici CRL 75-36-700-3]EHS62741.1 hypothetical protein PGTG_21207 [Puccinia graminis f. sp. tritici CRL 75-36-700-3]
MIVEDECGVNLENFYKTLATVSEVSVEQLDTRGDFSQFISNFRALQSKATHITLRNDLIKHHWDLKGRSDL